MLGAEVKFSANCAGGLVVRLKFCSRKRGAFGNHWKRGRVTSATGGAGPAAGAENLVYGFAISCTIGFE